MARRRNLNGDYLSDALAAQVGGIGIAPGGNVNYVTCARAQATCAAGLRSHDATRHRGHAIFEATHGTAPKYAGLDKVNPGSVILSGEMMFRHLGWNGAGGRTMHAQLHLTPYTRRAALDRGCRPDHQEHGQRDRRQDCDLRCASVPTHARAPVCVLVLTARALCMADFARMMQGAKLLKCSEFGDAMIKHM